LTDVDELSTTDSILLIINKFSINTRINDNLHSIDRDGGLGNTSRKDEFVLLCLEEYLSLLSDCNFSVQRKDSKHPRVEVFLENRAKKVDIIDSCAKDKHISFILVFEL